MLSSVELENTTYKITKQTSLSKPTLQLSHAALKEPATVWAGDVMKSCHGANVVSGFHTATCLIDFIIIFVS